MVFGIFGCWIVLLTDLPGGRSVCWSLFREFAPGMRFHLEIHPALLSDEVKELLRELPAGLLHLEAGIQSLRENVLQACRRIGDLQAALDGLRYLASLPHLVVHADLIAGLPLYSLEQMIEDVRVLAGFGTGRDPVGVVEIITRNSDACRGRGFGNCLFPGRAVRSVADESDVGGGFASSPVVVSFD